MPKKLSIAITEDQQQRLNDLCLKEDGRVDLDSVANYALELGIKLVESGLDSDELIRSLQEPGTGLDLNLIMAKRRSQGDKQKPQDMAIRAFSRNSSIDESITKIAPEDYDMDFD
jgi:hypothetical protein